MVKTIAITGGIGSGKSELTSIIENFGYVVLSADKLAREILEEADVVSQILSAFGPDVFKDGQLIREKMRDIVFSDPQKRQTLESITHPAIAARFEKYKASLRELGQESWLFYEAPVIIESGRHVDFDALILVTATEGVRLQRLKQSRGLEESVARQIMSAQLIDSEKQKYADFVINNSGTKSDLLQNTRLAILHLQNKFQR